MMIMRRREGEKILIGDDIVIHIAQIGRNRVRIGIEAPRDLVVVAEEVRRVAEVNNAAACTGPEAVKGLVERLQAAGFREPAAEHEGAPASLLI
ncbi:MAG: carbon storage regulator [Bryobacteraceae bacterium]|nr:carbon storage regulator [Bryobacteraceae bacterium]